METNSRSTFQNLAISANFAHQLSTKVSKKEELEELSINLSWDGIDLLKETQPEVLIRWYVDIINFQYSWTPTSDTDHGLVGEWTEFTKTMFSRSIPMITFYNENEKSRYTCAVSDAKNEIHSLFSVKEENGQLECTIKIPMAQLSEETNYQVKLLNDFTEQNVFQAIKSAVQWIITSNNLTLLKAPANAFQPAYSTWYSFHQSFTTEELEEEARLAHQIGLETFILDDGWQTGDNNRGYAFCGDWQVEASKVSDMKCHIQTVKNSGFKDYLLWYSVPYLGVKSTHWQEFKEKILYFDETVQAGILDPRYPEVREYLIKTYVAAVNNWQLTGLKLDFIDLFYHQHQPQYSEEMSPSSLQEAVNQLLEELTSQLLAINADFLFEFRQDYIGPFVQQYGNIFRVSDCPSSLLQNRIGIVDLRLICPEAAVHSDMLMWHKDEEVEAAALAILSGLFGAVQLSVKLGEQDAEKLEMLTFWLAFMKKYQATLLKSEFLPHHPQQNYSWVEAWDEQTRIVVSYASQQVIELSAQLKAETIMINATLGTKLTINLRETQSVEISIYNCQGRLIEEYDDDLIEGLHELDVPACGLVKIKTRGVG